MTDDQFKLSAAASPTIKLSGFIGGGQAGYNRQTGNWVWGIEGDFDYFGLHGSQSASGLIPPPPLAVVALLPTPFNVGTSVSTDWLATLRPRIGWAADNLLFYGTGGLALANEKFSQTLTLGAVTDTTTFSTVRVGWTVGGGVEWALNPSWSLKLEYLYVDLGTTGANAGAFTPVVPALSSSSTMRLTSNIVRAGFNYHFAPPPPPPPMPMAAPMPPPAAPKVFIVFFDWDKDTITPEGHAIVQQAADAWKSGAPVQIQVTGYTDRSGSAGYNQRLSERRANNVARALAALGVPREQMAVSGRGENDNRVPTADGVREPQNRRVEIVTP